MAFSRDDASKLSGRQSWLKKPRRLPFAFTLLVAAAVGGAGALGLSETGLTARLLGETGWAVAARDFPVCAGSTRRNCVVDGDTFWLDGVKIRLADINTPEIGDPACAEEARMGRVAQQRLVQLLNEGEFELFSAGRDEDQYGRKLRVAERNGRSIGQILVAEGLAHEWQGRRESWC